MIAGKLFQKRPPNRTAPIVFKMVKPIRGLDERRTLACRRISYANTISSRAKMNFLFHLISTKARPLRLHRSSRDLITTEFCADGECHRFSPAVQFMTTVKGTGVES